MKYHYTIPNMYNLINQHHKYIQNIIKNIDDESLLIKHHLFQLNKHPSEDVLS
jgi:hypothetical protein